MPEEIGTHLELFGHVVETPVGVDHAVFKQAIFVCRVGQRVCGKVSLQGRNTASHFGFLDSGHVSQLPSNSRALPARVCSAFSVVRRLPNVVVLF